MTDMEKKLVIEGDQFEKMRLDANAVLQKLLKNMVEKNTLEGKLQISIDISLEQGYIPIPKEQQTEESGESRRVLKPQIKHKIASTMQIKDDLNGAFQNDSLELVYDEDTKSYVLKPVTGDRQMNIFDMMDQKKEESENEDDNESKAVSGKKFIALPAPEDPSDEPEEPDDTIEGEFREVPPEDDSDNSDDEDDDDSNDDDDIGGYEYQDPDDEWEEEEE